MSSGRGFQAAQYELENPPPITINTDGAYIGPITDGTEPNIALPNHHSQVLRVSLDIGGTLCKVAYFKKSKSGKGGKLQFETFQTAQLNEWLDFLQQIVSKTKAVRVVATGGGAFKFYDKIKQRLGVEVQRVDEIYCLITGASFLARNIPEEIFCYDIDQENPIQYTPAPTEYPWLLVNIGSGVSIIKVHSPTRFERIGGSSLGGGTLWGLLRMLTPAKTFDDMLAMALEGNNTNVDMMVGDIYGDSYEKIGLKSTAIASSFGKAFKNPEQNFDPNDISRSLLYAVSNNIGQLAYLHARNHNIEHIFFGGSYIRGHPQTMHTLAYAINFWSHGEKRAYFFRHEGYLGAVGAFLDERGELVAESPEPPSE